MDTELKLTKKQERVIELAKTVNELDEDECGNVEAAVTQLLEHVVALGGKQWVKLVHDQHNNKWNPIRVQKDLIKTGSFERKVPESARLVKELIERMEDNDMRVPHELRAAVGATTKAVMFKRLSETRMGDLSDYQVKATLMEQLRKQTGLVSQEEEDATCC